MNEELILVDSNDNPIGTASREECHKGMGKRHRSFVVFLFDKNGRVLLQFRSESKLGGNRWDVTATSHVRNGETYEAAADRCLKYELGMSVQLEKIGAFTYTERYEGFSENEYCAAFIGRYDGELKPNAAEMDKVEYFTLDNVKKDFNKTPSNYTKWFRDAFPILLDFVSKSNYLED